tara:strand:+ start:1023 stop:1277 length:255 start_codon:yes stop_codon:yes gene_type:complete
MKNTKTYKGFISFTEQPPKSLYRFHIDTLYYTESNKYANSSYSIYLSADTKSPPVSYITRRYMRELYDEGILQIPTKKRLNKTI